MSSGRVLPSGPRGPAQLPKRASHDADAHGAAGSSSPAEGHGASRKVRKPSKFYSPLPHVETDVVEALQRSGPDGASLGELATRTNWPANAIKTVLDALERRGAAHFRFRSQAWHLGEDL